MGMLKTMMGSKKFVAMLVGVIGTLMAKIGWDVDAETIQNCVILIAGYCVGQGIADAGKEAEAAKRVTS